MTSTKESMAEDEEIIILTGDNCPPCAELEEILKDSKPSIKYRFVDVNSEEGQKIISEGTEQLSLPLALKVKKRVDVEECELFFDSETVLVKDKKGEMTALKE